MENFKNWINKHKSEIVIILGAMISIATSFATLDANYATVSSVIIAVVTGVIAILKEGITENSINLLSKAIYIIIKELKENEDNMKLSSSNDLILESDLSVDDIKELLIMELNK